MAIKADLQAAKSALDDSKYEEAAAAAQRVLTADPQNFNGQLLYGRACEKQRDFQGAERAYRAAAKAKPHDRNPWLGLCSVYEALGTDKIDEYHEATLKVADILAEADDKHRCQVAVDKFVAFAEQFGSREQYRHALGMLLPDSSIYDFLQGRIPHASSTYMRLVKMMEEEEVQRIRREIAERRTRIGATLSQVTVDVKNEVLGNSPLEGLYQKVIDWSLDDGVRREYEEKLLQRAYDVLAVLPVKEKAGKREQVLMLARGMVIIHHGFRLAWDLVIESKDPYDLQEFDVNVLQEYTSLFPDTGLAKVLSAWLSSERSPFPTSDEDENPMSLEVRLVLLVEGLSEAGQSPLAHRIVSTYYLHIEEYESAADTARTGVRLATAESHKLGTSLQNTKDALNTVLATALVHHLSPKYHTEARQLFEDILKRDNRSSPALMGLGLILEETEDYTDAITYFTRALDQDPGNERIGIELAWCRALCGDYLSAREELETYLSILEPTDRDLRALALYRIGICIWELDPSKPARKSRDGAYSYFLNSIQTNRNFAPAYTSLGYYYADYAKDKKRAPLCFQKAFELSSAETDAAERLARIFADKGEWDLVEAVAQRVVDSGRARPPPGSKKKGLSWPFSALGVVQMNRQEFRAAIPMFHTALRMNPGDFHACVGLGESYHNCGRYGAALKALGFALEGVGGGGGGGEIL